MCSSLKLQNFTGKRPHAHAISKVFYFLFSYSVIKWHGEIIQATIWTCSLINTSNTPLLWTHKLTKLYVFVLLIVLLKGPELAEHTQMPPVCLNEHTHTHTQLKWWKSSRWKSFMIDWQPASMAFLCASLLNKSAWNQTSAPDALATCIPAAEACIVHTSHQPAQFKYFAVFKVLLNFSSTFLPDPFQMCEPQAKWGGSKLHTYVLIDAAAVCEQAVGYNTSIHCIHHLTNSSYYMEM